MVLGGQRAASGQGWPALVCICGLCECGGHKCSDFNDWCAAQNGEEARAQVDHAGSCSGSEQAESAARHPCSYNCAAAPLDERYLTRTTAAATAARDEAPQHGPARSTTPGDVLTGQPAEAEAEILHVLVTRPPVAARPRDNIVFEGDMDLRTTFETSYEALARARLEHWRRHQEQRAQRRLSGRHDVSVSEGCGQPAALATGLDDARGEPSAGGRSRGDRADDSKLRRPPETKAESQSPAGEGAQAQSRPSPQMGSTGQGATPTPERAPSLGRATAAGASTAGQQKVGPRAQGLSQQDHFIDPDLSPIIVYDANLNRLERVGLRKRSKYRPSTSLRPGGRGFFGAAEAESGDGRRMGAGGTRSEGAPSGARPPEQPANRAPAGATSETLNRGQDGVGRKHHLGHANRVDHISQMRLAEGRRSAEGDENCGAQPAESAADDERQLALEEEAAAMAEIQRLVVTNDNDDGDRHRVESRQSVTPAASRASRLARHATIASPAEAAALATTPAASNDALRSSSRSSRMERVCQNQSFYLCENDYPAASDELGGGPQRQTRDGGRETAELSRQLHRGSPQGVRARQNLFRESPDFIMTTGQMWARLEAEQTEHGQESAVSRAGAAHGLQDGAVELDEFGSQEVDHDDGGSRVEPSKCPVLKLGCEFEFMGSKRGHKYFVEKQAMAQTINEIC